MADPKIGEDGLVFEDRPLSMSTLQAIPTEVGLSLWKTPAVYSCLEANEHYIVIGSEQGYVWVVDLETSKLIREYSEFRGTAMITVIRLSPSRDLLAYGTSDGHVRVDKITRQMSNKLRLQEKVKQGVRALEWNGDELFCGFELGRVIRMKINIYDWTMSPLTFPDSYGSGVTQLSCKGNSLLVSTVERTWMVDTDTHKLEQVGRKDRKAGQYGGCLVGSGETAYVARPGLRLWAADNSGKVLRTVVYKEALSTQALPRVPLHSWSSLVPSYNRAWQFNAVLPWVGEHFVITCSEHTLFILDPKNGLIVGVLAIGHAITDIAVTRSFVYLLCNDLKKPICRISVKQAFLRALKRALPSSPVPSPALTRNKVTPTGPTLTVPTIAGKVEADNDKRRTSPIIERKEKETSNVESEIESEVGKVGTDSTSELYSTVNVLPIENTISTENDISSNTQSSIATLDQTLPTNHQPALVATDQPLPTTTPAGPNSSSSEYMEDEYMKDEDTEQTIDRDELTTDIPVKVKGDTQPQTETETETVTLPSQAQVSAMIDEPLSLLDTIDTPTPQRVAETPSDAQPRAPSEEDATTVDPNVKPSTDSDTKTEQVLDSSTNTKNDSSTNTKNDSSTSTKNDSSTSTKNDSSTSMQQEQKEPTLQDALQTVKAEMKELFKPITFDKLSNIFKSHNPGSSSPSRLRVLASRNRKTESEESKSDIKSENLDVQIEEIKNTSEVANQKDEQEPTKRPDLKEILKLSRIGNLLSKDSSSSTGAPMTTPIIITPAPLDAEEQERRLRMSQSTADDHDDVVVVKKDKKKRKKRKYKKLSSATSSVSVSLEKLTEIEEEVEDSPTLSAIATPLSRATSPSVPFTLTVEQTMKLELLKLERNDESKSVEREQTVLESLPERPTEEEKNETEVIPPMNVESVEEIDESNPEQISLEQDETIIAEPVLDTPHTEDTLDDVTTPKDDTTETLDRPASPPLFEDTDSSPSDPLFSEDPLDVIHSPTPSGPDTRAGSREKSLTATLGDLSDNPLYHNSDHEVETMGRVNSEATYTKDFLNPNSSRTRNTVPAKFQSSLLQPVKFDPLQSDDSSEGLLGSRQEDDKLVDSTPVNLRPRMLSASPDTRRRKKVRPTPVISGSWDGYNVSRNAREMSAEASDSSHEDDDDENLVDSQVASDFYQLCGSLVRHSNQSKEAKASVSSPQKFSWTASEFQRQSVVESDEEESDEGPVSNADIWVPIPHPGRSQIQCVCLSESLLWIVDGRKNVFCTTTASKGKDWQHIKKPMSQVCSSHSGNIVWAVHHWNAYVRLGIGLNPAGSYWRNTTKGTFMSRKIKYLAVSETGVWGITTDNRTIYRKGVNELSPGGKMWLEVSGEGFSHISCCKNIVWAHTNHGKVFIREGITPSTPSGRKWSECKCPKMISSCLTCAGVAWVINHEGSIGFRCGITASKPSGKGPWWEVKINALTHASSPYNSLWQVMGSEGSHLLTSVTNMLPHLMPHSKPLVLSASSKAGVIILQDSNRLHACWRTATGYHYRPASKSGLFSISTWSNMAAGSTGLWLVRDDGDLHCLTTNDNLKRIECPSAITHVAASPACVWIVADSLVWSRQGLGEEVPEGASFDYIEMSIQLHERKIQHIACGKTAVWALDKTGIPHFRFGVHSREPGTGMSPAWIPVIDDDFPHPLFQISVCPDDWLVWARDDKYNCYVRTGVTHDFPIGKKWELVPSEQIRELCVTNEYVYGLTPSGELLCRYGISEENVQGNYWRRMPGRYEHLTTGQNGELWTLDPKGQVWKQESKILAVSHDPKAGQNDFETSMTVDQSWEVV